MCEQRTHNCPSPEQQAPSQGGQAATQSVTHPLSQAFSVNTQYCSFTAQNSAPKSCRCTKGDYDYSFCEASPAQEGTICGADGDYFEFDTCNKGPGFCKTIESDYGDFGICVGIPKLGAACNDYDDCTKDDKCKVVVTDDGAFRGQCMGKFAGEIPCNDYNDDCTSNDRCGSMPSLIFWNVTTEKLSLFLPM